MIYSVPRPETDRSTKYSSCRSIYLITVSFNVYSQDILDLIKNISCAKSVGNDHTLRLPSVCVLKKDRNRELIYLGYISNVNVCVIYRIILRLSTRIIMTAKNNNCVTGNGKASGYNSGITKCILYLKLNGMSAGKKLNIIRR